MNDQIAIKSVQLENWNPEEENINDLADLQTVKH